MLDTQQRSSGNVDVDVVGLDAQSIRSIETATGWTNVSNCSFTQFAVGTAHSPLTPTKLYSALRYTDDMGNDVITPLSQVISYSTSKSQNPSQKNRS